MPTKTYSALRLSPLPNQSVQTVINGQSFVIHIRQIGASLFTSTNVDGEQITETVRATDGGSLTPWPHSAVKTDLRWVDTVGHEPPNYAGLGDRWLIVFEDSTDGEQLQ